MKQFVALVSVLGLLGACSAVPLVQASPPPPQNQYAQQGQYPQGQPPQGQPQQGYGAPTSSVVTQAAPMEAGLSMADAIAIGPGSKVEAQYTNNVPKQRYYALPMTPGQKVKITGAMQTMSGGCNFFVKIMNSRNEELDTTIFSKRDIGREDTWELTAPYADTFLIEMKPSCSTVVNTTWTVQAM